MLVLSIGHDSRSFLKTLRKVIEPMIVDSRRVFRSLRTLTGSTAISAFLAAEDPDEFRGHAQHDLAALRCAFGGCGGRWGARGGRGIYGVTLPVAVSCKRLQIQAAPYLLAHGLRQIGLISKRSQIRHNNRHLCNVRRVDVLVGVSVHIVRGLQELSQRFPQPLPGSAHDSRCTPPLALR